MLQNLSNSRFFFFSFLAYDCEQMNIGAQMIGSRFHACTCYNEQLDTSKDLISQAMHQRHVAKTCLWQHVVCVIQEGSPARN